MWSYTSSFFLFFFLFFFFFTNKETKKLRLGGTVIEDWIGLPEDWTSRREVDGLNPTRSNLSLRKAFDANTTNFVCSWKTGSPEQDSILQGKGCDKMSDQIQAPQGVRLFCHTPQPIFPFIIHMTTFQKQERQQFV